VRVANDLKPMISMRLKNMLASSCGKNRPTPGGEGPTAVVRRVRVLSLEQELQ
jgi:hypothetical protein